MSVTSSKINLCHNFLLMKMEANIILHASLAKEILSIYIRIIDILTFILVLKVQEAIWIKTHTHLVIPLVSLLIYTNYSNNNGIWINCSISQTALFQCVRGIYTRRKKNDLTNNINFGSVPFRKIPLLVWILVICGTERNENKKWNGTVNIWKLSICQHYIKISFWNVRLFVKYWPLYMLFC